MSEFKHTAFVLLAIFLAYTWLATPNLSYYSLQAFCAGILAFFIAKRLSKSRLWHILPKDHSFEMVFISFAVIVLIGSTGNTDSLFYPLAYIHLFFLVMTTRQTTAIAATLATMLTHYALDPSLSSTHVATLLSLPLMLVFFLFARRQYDEALSQKKIAVKEKIELSSMTASEHTLESFITQFLQPKLKTMLQILDQNQQIEQHSNTAIMKNQIELLASEGEKIIEKTRTQS